MQGGRGPRRHAPGSRRRGKGGARCRIHRREVQGVRHHGVDVAHFPAAGVTGGAADGPAGCANARGAACRCVSRASRAGCAVCGGCNRAGSQARAQIPPSRACDRKTWPPRRAPGRPSGRQVAAGAHRARLSRYMARTLARVNPPNRPFRDENRTLLRWRYAVKPSRSLSCQRNILASASNPFMTYPPRGGSTGPPPPPPPLCGAAPRRSATTSLACPRPGQPTCGATAAAAHNSPPCATRPE